MEYHGLGFTPKSDLSILVEKLNEFIKEDAEKTFKLIVILNEIDSKLDEIQEKLKS